MSIYTCYVKPTKKSHLLSHKISNDNDNNNDNNRECI